MTRWLSLALALTFAAGASGQAAADCVETPRRLVLDSDTRTVLKAYECRSARGDGARVRAEFYRLSDTAASLIASRNSSEVLKKVIGTPKLVENEIFKTYAELLRSFGAVTEVPRVAVDSSSMASVGAASVTDKISARRLQTFFGGVRPSSSDFPAVPEITALRKKIIPPDLKYYFSFDSGECGIPGSAGLSGRSPVCAKYQNQDVRMTFWRGLQVSDVTDYAKSVRAYNSMLKQLALQDQRPSTGGGANESTMSATTPRELRLAAHMAGDTMPDDFILLSGTFVRGSCGDDGATGSGNWSFLYHPRQVLLEAVLIENPSSQAIVLDGLMGERRLQSGLRAVGRASPPASNADLALETSESLAPGQKLLVPIRILLPPPEVDDWSSYHRVGAEMSRRLGANGFTGSTESFRVPRPRTYLYGPELNVSGVVVNGRRMEFVRQASNFLDLTVTAEVGSCPYLQSAERSDGQWIEHGKVLHRALGRAREDQESITFPGFRARYRLEEREAEVAFIDHAELVITLADGTSRSLVPSEPDLARRDAQYLTLFWGDSSTFVFDLPEEVAEIDVVESRLTLSGYYERYGDLLASRSQLERAMGRWPKAGLRSDAGAAVIDSAMCRALERRFRTVEP